METGYLFVESSPTHPGIVRIRIAASNSAEIPDLPALSPTDDGVVRLVARFRDVEAARMHAHEALRRRLLDPENRTYRAEVNEVLAAIDAIGLQHQRVYRDPDLSAADLANIEGRVAAIQRHAMYVDRAWQIVGGLAVAFLVLLAMTSGLR